MQQGYKPQRCPRSQNPDTTPSGRLAGKHSQIHKSSINQAACRCDPRPEMHPPKTLLPKRTMMVVTYASQGIFLAMVRSTRRSMPNTVCSRGTQAGWSRGALRWGKRTSEWSKSE